MRNEQNERTRTGGNAPRHGRPATEGTMKQYWIVLTLDAESGDLRFHSEHSSEIHARVAAYPVNGYLRSIWVA